MYVVVLAHGEGGTEMATLLKRDANFQCMRSSNGFLCAASPLVLTNMVFCYGHHMSGEYILKLIAYYILL